MSGSWAEDRREYILLCLILLCCPDLLDLTNRQEVEALQLSFTTRLQRYLQYK